MDISHKLVRNYILGNLKKTELKSISKLRKQDTVSGQLFQIIDLALSAASAESLPKSVPHLSHADLEETILALISGSSSHRIKETFLAALLASPVTLHRLQEHLNQISPLEEVESLPELKEIKIPDDQKIIDTYLNRKKTGKYRFLPALRPLPKAAWGAIGTVFCAVMILVIMHPAQNDPFAEYIYDTKVPCSWDSMSFRSAEHFNNSEPKIRKISNTFQSGMSDYLVQNYQHALSVFLYLIPTLDSLMITNKTPELVNLSRDIHFYTGLSYMALFRSKKYEISDEKRREFGDLSVRHIAKADRLTVQYLLTHPDRMQYFLGLAYAFIGEKEAAIAAFDSIREESAYANRKRALQKALLKEFD